MTEPTEPIARIEAALRKLGEEHVPPAGWEARVLAATAPRRRTAWWWFLAPAMLAAAALIYLVLPHRKATALQLAVVTEKAGAVKRGPAPQLGDIVHVTAAGGGEHRALWIYHNETVLVIVCPGQPHCRETDDAVTADVELTRIGTYQLVALSASEVLPTPTGHFDADLAAAERADLTVSRQELNVR